MEPGSSGSSFSTLQKLFGGWRSSILGGSDRSWQTLLIWQSVEVRSVGPAKSHTKTRFHTPVSSCSRGDSCGIPPLNKHPRHLYFCNVMNHLIYMIDGACDSILKAGFDEDSHPRYRNSGSPRLALHKKK